MLSNSIAEMRAYGEGFIIADQSPGLLDMSVIRNTNTKIILRLPDESDRELVGRAASLNDDQIVELARLQIGVAAVFQNDWIQPVLCKVNLFEKPKELYKSTITSTPIFQSDSDDTIISKKRITKYQLSNIINESYEFDKEKLKEEVLNSKIDAVTKTAIFDFMSKYDTQPNNIEYFYHIIGKMYSCPKEILDKVLPCSPIYTQDELTEFNSIVDKTPNYACNEMTWDEHINGRTRGLIPSGYLHSGSGGGSVLPHIGGHKLIEAAEEIRNNRP